MKHEMIKILEDDGWICGPDDYGMSNLKFPGKWFYWPHFTEDDFKELGYEL